MKRLLKRGVKAIKDAYSDAADDGSWLATCVSKTVDCLRANPDYSRISDDRVYDLAYQRCWKRRFA